MPVFVDIDNDGDFDAFIGEDDGIINYYKNTGNMDNPVFTMQTGSSNPLTGVDVGFRAAPTFVDIDNDGDFDAFVGGNGGSIKYYENTGTPAGPVYVQQTGTANPLNEDFGSRSVPIFVDIDNDGDYDPFIGIAVRVDFYPNVGNNTNLVVVLPCREPVYEDPTPVLVDIDNDSDFDLFAGDIDGKIRYYKNIVTVATPDFDYMFGADNPVDWIDEGRSSAPDFVDIDGDGDFDLFAGDRDGTISYTINTGTNINPLFQSGGSSNPLSGQDVGAYSAPAFVDIDNDGDYDLFVGNFSGTICHFKNTGTASMPSFFQQIGMNNPLSGVDVGMNSHPCFVDIDGDDDFDVFIGNENGKICHYKNTGSNTNAVFTIQMGIDNPLNGIDEGDHAVPSFADLDADGDFDVVIGWHVNFAGTVEDGMMQYYQNQLINTSACPTPDISTFNADLCNAPPLALTWDAVPGAITYEFFGRKATGNMLPQLSRIVTVPGFNVAAAPPNGFMVEVQLRAQCSGGNWSDWTPLTPYTITCNCPMPDPATLTGSSCNDMVVFNWDAAPGAVLYDFYAENQVGNQQLSLTVTNPEVIYNGSVPNGFPIAYQLRAFCSNGVWSDWTPLTPYIIECPAICPEMNITLSTQTQIDNFSATYPNCTSPAVTITIEDDDDGTNNITNLDGLSGLTAIGGNLLIIFNDALVNVNGLSSLTIVGENLIVIANPLLSSCCGLFPLLNGGGVSVSMIINSNLSGCNSEAEIISGGSCLPGPALPNMTPYNVMSQQSDNSEQYAVLLYPNPFSNSLNMEYYNEHEDNVQLQILDILGNTIYLGHLPTEPGLQKAELELGGLAQGSYLLKLKIGDRMIVKKFVKL